jgi:hypothetical protein
MNKEKTTVLSVRVTVKQKEYIEMLAKRTGYKDTSQYIHWLITCNVRETIQELAWQMATTEAARGFGVINTISYKELEKIMEPQKFEKLTLEIATLFPSKFKHLIETFNFEKENEELEEKIQTYLKSKFDSK